MLTTFFKLSFLTLLAKQCRAAVYYVDTDGGGDATDLATFCASDVLAGGDVVYLRGTQEHSVCILRDLTFQPSVRFTGQGATNHQVSSGFTFFSVWGVEIDSMQVDGTIKNDGRNGAMCGNMYLHHLLMAPTREYLDQALTTSDPTGLAARQVYPFLFMGCGDPDAPSLVEYTWSQLVRKGITTSNHLTFRRSVVEYALGDHTMVTGSGVTIENVMTRATLAVDADHRDLLQVWAGRTQVRDLVIKNNFFTSSWPPNYPESPLRGSSQGVSAFDDDVDNLKMVGNIIMANHHHGTSWYQMLSNSLIAGNTLINAVRESDPSYIGKCWIRVVDGVNNVIANNVGRVVPSGDGNVKLSKDADIDAAIMDRDAIDMRPTASSVIRGGAINVAGAPATDIFGNDYSASSPEAGAVAYGSTGNGQFLIGINDPSPDDILAFLLGQSPSVPNPPTPTPPAPTPNPPAPTPPAPTPNPPAPTPPAPTPNPPAPAPTTCSTPFYAKVSTPMTFTQAIDLAPQDCRLAPVGSTDVSSIATEAGADQCWVGITKNIQAGDATGTNGWTNIGDGSTVPNTSSIWYPGEPNNSVGAQSKATINFRTGGLLRDVSDNDVMPCAVYVCCDTSPGNTAETASPTASPTAAPTPTPFPELENGVVHVLDLNEDETVEYVFYPPTGAVSIVCETWGGSGDSDLHVNKNSRVMFNQSSNTCFPYLKGNTESCGLSVTGGDYFYVGVSGYKTTSGVSLRCSVDAGLV